jgi:hypothetical protein
MNFMMLKYFFLSFYVEDMLTASIQILFYDKCSIVLQKIIRNLTNQVHVVEFVLYTLVVPPSLARLKSRHIG